MDFELTPEEQEKLGFEESNKKKLSKKFKAAVKILTHIISSKSEFKQEELVNILDRYNDLGKDAFKHALKTLSSAKLITNIYGNEQVSIYWRLHPSIKIYAPTKEEVSKNKISSTSMLQGDGLRMKVQMAISCIDEMLSSDTVKMARSILKSNIMNFSVSTYFGQKMKDGEIIICDIEKNTYWKEELETIKKDENLNQEEFNQIMYNKTQDIKYLPDTAKEMFIF